MTIFNFDMPWISGCWLSMGPICKHVGLYAISSFSFLWFFIKSYFAAYVGHYGKVSLCCLWSFALIISIVQEFGFSCSFGMVPIWRRLNCYWWDIYALCSSLLWRLMLFKNLVSVSKTLLMLIMEVDLLENNYGSTKWWFWFLFKPRGRSPSYIVVWTSAATVDVRNIGVQSSEGTNNRNMI